MPRLISIDLGTHAVKVNTYRVTGRRYDFEERYRIPVPQDGEVPTLEARLAALDGLLADHPELAGGGSDVVAVAFPAELASFHRLHMPFADRAQIEKTLPFAVEALVPFDLDEMVLGWRLLRQGQAGSDMMTALVRREHIEQWIDALVTRQLDPAVIYVDSEVLGHYGQTRSEPTLGDGPPDGILTERPSAVAVVDIGHTRTLVSVTLDGNVQMTRAINVGGYAFTRAIQTALKCSWMEAEARKHGMVREGPGDLPAADEATDVEGGQSKPLSGYSQLPEEARAAMDGAIGLLLAELRSTLIDAEDRCEVSIEELRLTGGGARIQELWSYLATDLGVQVKRAKTPSGLRLPGTHLLAHALAQHVTRETAGEAINLRIGDLEYRGGTDLLRAILVYGSSGLAFFSLAALVMFAVQYRSLMVELSDANAQVQEVIASTFPEIPPETEMDVSLTMTEVLLDDARQRAAILSRGETGVPPTIDLLATLTNAFPPHPEVEVEVEQLTIATTQITFDAETDGYASSARVEQDLQNHPRFKNATKGQETRLTNGRVKFPIHIPFGVTEEEEL